MSPLGEGGSCQEMSTFPDEWLEVVMLACSRVSAVSVGSEGKENTNTTDLQGEGRQNT